MSKANSRALKNIATAMAMALAIILTNSCTKGKVCQQYQHINDEEWDRADTIAFSVPRVKTPAIYQMEAGIRLTLDYPYSNLSMTVITEVIPDTTIADTIVFDSLKADSIVNKADTAPKIIKRTPVTLKDTVLLAPYDEEGDINGSGVRNYQMAKPYRTMQLREGDSLSVRIIHNMRKGILPGITDVGLIITEADKIKRLPSKKDFMDMSKRLKEKAVEKTKSAEKQQPSTKK